MSEETVSLDEFRALQKQVRTLLDKQEIIEIMYKYARAIDRGDEELLNSLFHPDARIVHVGLYEGDGAGYAKSAIPSLVVMGELTHRITNPLVEVDGDTATGECSLQHMAHCLPEHWGGKEFDWISCGRFIHKFEKRDGTWKILHRKMILDWNQYLPHPKEPGNGAIPLEYVHITAKRDKSDESYRPGLDPEK